MAKFTLLKKQVYEASLWLSNNGFFGGLLSSGGNVSLLNEDREFVTITPSARQYATMTYKDICVLDMKGKSVESTWNPSIETAMHLGIYKERRDVFAVVHTHQTYASVLSIINKPLPALFDEINMAIGSNIGIVPYFLSGTEELALAVRDYFRDGRLCAILKNHGAVSVGGDLPQALKNAEILEKVCRIYYLALASGQPISTLDKLPPNGA